MHNVHRLNQERTFIGDSGEGEPESKLRAIDDALWEFTGEGILKGQGNKVKVSEPNVQCWGCG